MGDKPGLPYDRPPLSKEMLAGKWEPDQLPALIGPYIGDVADELESGRLGDEVTHDQIGDFAGNAVGQVAALRFRLARDLADLAHEEPDQPACSRPAPENNDQGFALDRIWLNTWQSRGEHNQGDSRKMSMSRGESPWRTMNMSHIHT